MKKAFLSLCLFPLISFAETDYLDSASFDLVYEKAPEGKALQEEQKAFRLSAGLQQINGFIVSADHISQFFLSGSYQWDKLFSASFSQKLNRHFFLNPNSKDQGLWIQDSILSVEARFKNLPYYSSLQAGLSSTLPLSYDSQIKDLLTAGSIYLNWSLKLDPLLRLKQIKNLRIFAKPMARYYFSRWTTARTAGQSLGGTPLPEFLLGLQSAGLSLNITKYFSLSGAYGRWVIFSHSPAQRKRDEFSPYGENYQKHYYLLSLSGNFKISKSWSLSLSYSHIDRLDQAGRLEMVIFDDRASSWSIALSYSRAFNAI